MNQTWCEAPLCKEPFKKVFCPVMAKSFGVLDFSTFYSFTPAGLGLKFDHQKNVTENDENENACTTYIFITAYDHIIIIML